MSGFSGPEAPYVILSNDNLSAYKWPLFCILINVLSPLVPVILIVAKRTLYNLRFPFATANISVALVPSPVDACSVIAPWYSPTWQSHIVNSLPLPILNSAPFSIVKMWPFKQIAEPSSKLENPLFIVISSASAHLLWLKLLAISSSFNTSAKFTTEWVAKSIWTQLSLARSPQSLCLWPAR